MASDEVTKPLHPDFPDWLPNERFVYSTLGPHERITPCLNTSVFDLVSPADGGPDYDLGYNTETLRLARAANGDLRQYLHSHPDIEEHMRAKWGLQIAEGIAFLHEREIVWGDCSPTNVLLNAKLEVWLCDFAGSSLPFSPALTVAPPDRYCFPEMANFSADKRIDIYAFGCVFLEMLTWDENTVAKGWWLSNLHRGGLALDGERLLIDTVSFAPFKQIVQGCWDGLYKDGGQLFTAMSEAWAAFQQPAMSED
ncbi:kinase-like domain-containing protein [Mycena amicta]|nr:kinase-like domain-containing protein [Mycena amicta]